jgi:enoyl-CoA hydratase/carnithine racemase
MVRTTLSGAVRVVTLDRPERRNALDREALERLETAIDDASQPVVYLHGAGSAFCAGADLDVVEALDSESAADFAALGQRVANALAEYDGAVVAGIDGAARGGGVELALACDLRVATPEATLGEPGVQLGLFGAWGGTTRLPDIVGRGNAMDIALSGREIDAETAARMGLVSRVTERPRAVADELAAVDPRALRTLTNRLRDDADQRTGDERERAAFASLVANRDGE